MSSLYWRIREKIRISQLFQDTVGKAVYIGQILFYSNRGKFARDVAKAAKKASGAKGVALCVRIRDEAANLREFVEYYLAAGVSHIFFYEARSVDDFHAVLDPFVSKGYVTIIENFPHIPISPAAEHDCVRRCIGRYEWLGCIDADEFVVAKDNVAIDTLLKTIPAKRPAVGLHWRFFGSNGHKTRPSGPVIAEYSRCAEKPDLHVKVFLRPERVSHFRNCHSWYYRGIIATAVNEHGRRIYASTSLPPTADIAWINHYHHKSEAEYNAKASRASISDQVGMRFNNRTPARGKDHESSANAVIDDSAVNYHWALCQLDSCSICAAIPKMRVNSE